MIQQIEKQLKQDELSKVVYSENGAQMHSTSGKELLDFNFKVSSYRNKTSEEIINDFDKVWDEDRELALKYLFFLRDVREGLGERKTFRVCFKYLVTHGVVNIDKLFPLIGEYGRWDDLLDLIDLDNVFEPVHIINSQIAEVLYKQLAQDQNNYKNNKSISLLCKWLPSINTSSKKSRRLARYLLSQWKNISSEKAYRKLLSELRAYIKVTETLTSTNRWGEIDYAQVPSMANLKYRKAFFKHDEERRKAFLEKLEKGEVKINSSVAFPHDIVHQYYHAMMEAKIHWLSSSKHQFIADPAIEGMWKNQKQFDIADTLVVADGSGSMLTSLTGTTVMAIEIANALAIYCSEHNQGEFKDKYITFSNRPQLVNLAKSVSGKENSLADKLNICNFHNEVANTDIEKVFDLILRTAIENKMSQEEMVKQILIISDMEFDSGVQDSTFLMDEITQKFVTAGYKLPRLIYWNVCSRTGVIPMTQNENGFALLSGFSLNNIKMVMNNNLDMYEMLKEILMSDRYKPIIL